LTRDLFINYLQKRMQVQGRAGGTQQATGRGGMGVRFMDLGSGIE